MEAIPQALLLKEVVAEAAALVEVVPLLVFLVLEMEG
jgi:hypothetical protein